MRQPTFKEQFDKITTAYIKDELEPYQDCACFVGNLLNNTTTWAFCRRQVMTSGKTYEQCKWNESLLADTIQKEAGGFYTPEEILRLEGNFMQFLYNATLGTSTEDIIFSAMDSTLDMLRKIHESKGEVIEDYKFEKRQLA